MAAKEFINPVVKGEVVINVAPPVVVLVSYNLPSSLPTTIVVLTTPVGQLFNSSTSKIPSLSLSKSQPSGTPSLSISALSSKPLHKSLSFGTPSPSESFETVISAVKSSPTVEGSVSFPSAAVVLLVIVVPEVPLSTVTVTVNTAVEPLGKSPISHTPVPPVLYVFVDPPTDVALTNVTPAGNASIAVTPNESLGPLLVTVIW